jgi:hypothetical protein
MRHMFRNGFKHGHAQGIRFGWAIQCDASNSMMTVNLTQGAVTLLRVYWIIRIRYCTATVVSSLA